MIKLYTKIWESILSLLHEDFNNVFIHSWYLSHDELSFFPECIATILPSIPQFFEFHPSHLYISLSLWSWISNPRKSPFYICVFHRSWSIFRIELLSCSHEFDPQHYQFSKLPLSFFSLFGGYSLFFKEYWDKGWLIFIQNSI